MRDFFKVKLPHKLVQLGDVYSLPGGPAVVVAVDRHRDGFVILATDPTKRYTGPELTMQTLEELYEELSPRKAKAAE